MEIPIEPSFPDRTSITHSEGTGGNEGRAWGSQGVLSCDQKKVGSPAERSFLLISEPLVARRLLPAVLTWLLPLPQGRRASVHSLPLWGGPHCSVPWGSVSSLAVAGHPVSPANLLCCFQSQHEIPLLPKRSSAGTPGAQSRGDKDLTRWEAVV